MAALIGLQTHPGSAAILARQTKKARIAIVGTPIVHRDTIDMSAAWFQSRYDKSGPGGNGKDYIN